MKRFYPALAVFALLGSAAIVVTAQNEGQGAPQIIQHRTNPNGPSATPTVGSTGIVTPPITYHGGPLLPTPVIYYIWYGNWNQTNGSDTLSGQEILRDFGHNIGGSQYFAINKSYNAGGFAITGGVTWGGEAFDNYSQGTRLRDSAILAIVNRAFSSGQLTPDPNGVYFVLTSSDVAEQSGFCNKYCGWHTQGLSTYGTIRYSFVGNAFRCLNACAEQTIGPNGNAGVDGMVSVIAHELEETTTDPDASKGWYDRQGAENADKCAWTFGQSTKLSSGAYYNVTLGTRNYLIQRNLFHDLAGDTCRLDPVP